MKTLVIAPHPDDEALGCGGTLLRRKAEGIELAWLIVTGISEKTGWSTEMVRQRDDEIDKVVELIGFVLCAGGISYALRRGFVCKLLTEYTFLSRYHIKTDRVPFQAPRIASDQSKYAFPGFLLLS